MNSIEATYYKIIKVSHNFLFGIRKHLLVFLISMLLGATPFVLIYQSKADSYESSFTVSYEELVRKIYGDRLQKINTLLKQRNYDKIAFLLKIDKKTAESLKSVQGKNIIGEELSKDMNTDRIPFIVRMVVKDSNSIHTLQQGIVNFLEFGTDYMVEKNKIRQMEITEEINFINNQLQMMDSLKRKMRGGEEISMVNSKESNNLASLFQFSYELYKKRQDLLRKQELSTSLQVVDDAIVSKSTKRSALIYTCYSIIAGFIIYIIAVGFILPVLRYKGND